MIAQTMKRSERMIGHYWSKIRDVLGIYPDTAIEQKRNLKA
jgi:DNA-binding NarL/FixJ family response regulator